MAGQKISSFTTTTNFGDNDTLLLVRNQANFQLKGSAICSTGRADALQNQIDECITISETDSLTAKLDLKFNNYYTIENSLLSATEVEKRVTNLSTRVHTTNKLLTGSYIQLPSTLPVPAQAKSLDVLTFIDGKWQPYTGTTSVTSIALEAAAASLPIGGIVFYGRNTAPAGFLVCDGSQYARAAYPDLFAVIGTTFNSHSTTATDADKFRVPDLRGQFVRGFDNRISGGVDNDRVFGSIQPDSLVAHTHTVPNITPSLTNNTKFTVNATSGTIAVTNVTVGYGTTGTTSTLNPLTPAGGTETRPKNVALLPCIKSSQLVPFQVSENFILKPTTPQPGQLLSYNGTVWTASNSPVPATATAGQTLIWNNGWTAGSPTGLRVLQDIVFTNLAANTSTTITIPSDANRITLIFTDVIGSGEWNGTDPTILTSLNITIGTLNNMPAAGNYNYSALGLFVPPWPTTTDPDATVPDQLYQAQNFVNDRFYIYTAVMFNEGTAQSKAAPAATLYKKMSGTFTLTKGAVGTGATNSVWITESNSIIGGTVSGVYKDTASLTAAGIKRYHTRGNGSVTVPVTNPTQIIISQPKASTTIVSGSLRVICE